MFGRGTAAQLCIALQEHCTVEAHAMQLQCTTALSKTKKKKHTPQNWQPNQSGSKRLLAEACHYLVQSVAGAVWAEVEAVSEQAAGFLAVAEAELVTPRFGQQGAHRFKSVKAGFGQRTPATQTGRV